MSYMRLMLDRLADGSAPVGQGTPCVAAPANRGSEGDCGDRPAESGLHAGAPLYVATNLACWQPDGSGDGARQVTFDGVRYRLLDPEYFAWLAHRMDLAQQAVESGRFGLAALDHLRAGFQRVRDWAVAQFGEDVLAQALGARAVESGVAPADPDAAMPTRPHLFPNGDWPFTRPVSDAAVAVVEAIWDAAHTLGWSDARLWQNRGRFPFPHGQDFGLVCFVDANRRISDVTGGYIEIQCPPPSGTCLRFYNPDVKQPWVAGDDPEPGAGAPR